LPSAAGSRPHGLCKGESSVNISEIGFALIVGIFVMVLLQVLDVLPH
jgi:hypothetical protein